MSDEFIEKEVVGEGSYEEIIDDEEFVEEEVIDDDGGYLEESLTEVKYVEDFAKPDNGGPPLKEDPEYSKYFKTTFVRCITGT